MKKIALSLIAWGFFCGGLILLALTALLIWHGQAYAIPHIVYVEKPLPHFLGGLAGLFGWYVLSGGYRNSAREWARFSARCFLMFFSLGLCLVMGELAYRAYLLAKQNENSFEKFAADHRAGKKQPVHSSHPMALIIQPSDDRQLIYELQPGLDLQFGHKRLRTNADGMRETRDYPLIRQPNSVRIVGLGDSGMFGWGVEQDEAYMSVLERNLNASSSGTVFEVLNLAVPGYNTQLEAESFRVKGAKYSPDVVVIGWCVNDFDLPFFLLEKENFKRRDKSFLMTWMFARTNMANLANGFHMADLRNFNRDKVDTNVVAGTAAEGVSTALRQIQSACAGLHAHLLVFGPMRSDIIGICKSNGVDYVNTLEKIAADQYPSAWAVHFMHPRAEGHEVLAKLLQSELEKRGWLTPRSPDQKSAPAP